MIVGITILHYKRTHNDQSQNYSYYFFQLEWPATICLSLKCSASDLLNYDGTNFNIHGLWPSGKGSSQCDNYQDCSKQEYDQSTMSTTLVNWMNQYFVGVYNNSINFRAHEFQTHGTCWNDPNGQTQGTIFQNDYFTKIKEIYQTYDIMEDLRKLNIIPTSTKSYTLSQIKTAVNQAMGGQFNFPVDCLSINGKQYLQNINLCLGQQYQPQNCSCIKIDSCKSDQNIYFPLFQQTN